MVYESNEATNTLLDWDNSDNQVTKKPQPED